MAKIIWAPSASADLKNIAAYIANDSAKAARAQVAALINRAKILAKFPEIGRPVPELKIYRLGRSLKDAIGLFINLYMRKCMS